jgi:hypothetical protein
MTSAFENFGVWGIVWFAGALALLFGVYFWAKKAPDASTARKRKIVGALAVALVAIPALVAMVLLPLGERA